MRYASRIYSPIKITRIHFNVKEAYLAYHCSREGDCEDETCAEWLPYIILSGDVLNIRCGETRTVMETVRNVQFAKKVGVLSVIFEPDNQKTSAEVAVAVITVIVTSRYFPNHASDAAISKDEIVEENR